MKMGTMFTPASYCEIKERTHKNDERIKLLHAINAVLNERHEIETNFKQLSSKFNRMQKDETERREKYDQSRKELLHELEKKGGVLCKDHARLQHQIDHVSWHLEGCHRHRPCHGTHGAGEHCPNKKNTGSCISSEVGSVHKPSVMGNLKATSERLVKSIVDLRKKIYIVHEKLENELKRKREMEKKLSDLRKDISRQKKLLSVRRNSNKISIALIRNPAK
uniref:CSON012825 protein n=1 Tax=Culicoides sonorensis TaxID=179676 RepID=A0A336MAQ9_CULSO